MEQYSNDFATTLNGGIDNSTTTVVVTSATGAPAAATFSIKIDSEIMKVTTGGSSGTSWTVVRAQEGTAAASHADLAAVDVVLTKRSLDTFWSDNFNAGGYSGRPTAGRAGRFYLGSDAPVGWYDNGSTWQPVASQAGSLILVPDAPITLGSWTWVNQGGATATGKNGLVDFKCPADASDSIHLLAKSLPSAPYNAKIAVLPNYFLGGGFYMTILGLRESSTGKLKLISFMGDSSLVSQVSVDQYTNPTSYNAGVNRNKAPNDWPLFIRINDDNTNVNYQLSFDNNSWFTVKQEPRTTYFTADQVVFGMNNTNTGQDIRAWFLCYEES